MDILANSTALKSAVTALAICITTGCAALDNNGLLGTGTVHVHGELKQSQPLDKDSKEVLLAKLKIREQRDEYKYNEAVKDNELERENQRVEDKLKAKQNEYNFEREKEKDQKIAEAMKDMAEKAEDRMNRKAEQIFDNSLKTLADKENLETRKEYAEARKDLAIAGMSDKEMKNELPKLPDPMSDSIAQPKRNTHELQDYLKNSIEKIPEEKREKNEAYEQLQDVQERLSSIPHPTRSDIDLAGSDIQKANGLNNPDLLPKYMQHEEKNFLEKIFTSPDKNEWLKSENTVEKNWVASVENGSIQITV